MERKGTDGPVLYELREIRLVAVNGAWVVNPSLGWFLFIHHGRFSLS
ncbi:MAG: hypothetical protein NZM25_07345 [Leptospiraceae bacterium]|nr:hypothetical protein [Leptospiraceae bacterium]MDW8307134.1 hypothetical protein [Leptospiraceae bacterium]